jgi:hypothetical protein
MSITNDNIIIAIPIRTKGIDKNNVRPTHPSKEVEVITTWILVVFFLYFDHLGWVLSGVLL